MYVFRVYIKCFIVFVQGVQENKNSYIHMTTLQTVISLRKIGYLMTIFFNVPTIKDICSTEILNK